MKREPNIGQIAFSLVLPALLLLGCRLWNDQKGTPIEFNFEVPPTS